MDMTPQPPAPMSARKPYKAPRLTTYGSVRVLTQTGTGNSNESAQSQVSNKKPCERQFKHQVLEIGTHPLGFKLYLYQYVPELARKHGSGRQLGVMADEVAAVVPGAVSTAPDGYAQVDLAFLGISQAHH